MAHPLLLATPMSIYRRVLAYYRPFLAPTILATILSLVSIGFNLLKPWPFARIVDDVLPPAMKGAQTIEWRGATFPVGQAILYLCVALVVFHLLGGLLNLLTSMIYVKVGLRALLRLRTELYAYLHSLPLKFHDTRRSSDSTFRVAYDSQSIQGFYSKATFIFSATITIGSTFLIIWRLDPMLALLSLSIVPFMVAAIYFYAKRIRTESTDIQERESAVLTQAQEGLSSIKMVQAFGREEHEIEQFHWHAKGSLEANLRLTGTSMKSSLIVGTLMAVSTAAIFLVGSQHVLEGRLSLGSLIAISTYVVMLYSPLEALTHLAWALEGAAAAAQRCFEVLERADDVPDAPDAITIDRCTGEIVFENVSFGYTPERMILGGVNVRVAPGQTVAFVGGTGAGKSTLLSLVPRFYDPNVGRVLLDGHDLRALSKKSLRNQISIVLQDTLLFSTTVRENIAYGRPGATEEEIVEAAQRAQAHDFITAMHDGYSSQVGERGNHLSVGQRQRIGIARAFLKNAPILLLDEPTSALDPTTEASIMRTMEELMRGRTTLIITHRIATVHGVEKIVVLGPGGVVEEGTGSDLVARGGTYAKLYRSANLGS
ncbi:MAG: mdlB [Chthoniobacteraceae bacterium]|nr:mdlB [Chthoniobacteraceae bacterium]